MGTINSPFRKKKKNLPFPLSHLTHKISFTGLWSSQVVLVVKQTPANAGEVRDTGWIPGLGRYQRRAWQPTPVSWSEEPHGQRSLVGNNLWVAKSQTRLKRLSMHTPRYKGHGHA